MKATPFNVLSGENWFVANIYRASAFATTITAFIISSMKKTEGLVTAFFIDRNNANPDAKAVVGVGAQGWADYASLADVEVLCEFSGERDPVSRQITFGVGAVTPENVKAALTAAINGLNPVDQVNAAISGVAGVVDKVKELFSPRLAETKINEALNIAFDLVPLIRSTVENFNNTPSRVVVQFEQGVNTGSIKILAVPVASMPPLEQINTYMTAEVTPPELESVAQAASRNFGE